MISPHFVCLSMIVNNRYYTDQPHLTALDCLAYAIEREPEQSELPPIVAVGVKIFTDAMLAERGKEGKA